MNFSQLLQSFSCACGKEHSCEIEQIVIRPGALDALPALVEQEREILLVADTNTYAACGAQVVMGLQGKCVRTQIFDCEGFLIPNEDAIFGVRQKLTDRTSLILGVGSGVIQDLCKYVSFFAGLPYIIVATAPSMDGYASKGAAMILDNMKVTVTAHVPKAIIGDVDVLKQAPMDMIRSGYGDILGKFSCLNDWKLGQLVLDEYFCQYVYDMTWDMLQCTKDLGFQLQQRDPDAVQTLMEALIGIGIAMAYVGNSRPGSGSEHHLSHFFEITGILNAEPYLVHGTDVAYSAVATQRLREELLMLDSPKSAGAITREAWEAKIRELSDQLGLDCVLSRKAGKLSGGWQRRVSIAMALIGEPKILFLDEPTLGLDVLARHDLWDVIRDLIGKITVILTTHYMEEAESLSDRIGIMKSGRLLAVGTAEELKQRAGTEDFETAFVSIVKEERV